MVEVGRRDTETLEHRDEVCLNNMKIRNPEGSKPRCLVVFLSDAHLGSGVDSLERERQLCLFLDSIKHDCCELFLLGDMFDFWFSYRYLVPRGHIRLLGKLAEMADSGVRIHFFIGNHDMWVFDYLEKEIGAVMHDEPELISIDNKVFLIGHGDGLGHLDKGFDFMRRIFRSRINQRLFALLPARLTFPIANRWSDSNKVKHAKQNSLRYLGDDREGIVIYCKEQLKHARIDYCVFGHRHTPLMRELAVEGEKMADDKGNKTRECPDSASERLSTSTIQHSTLYFNTGDWLINRNYAIYSLTDHTFKLYDLQKGLIAGC